MGKFCSMRLTSLVLITLSAACDCIHILAFLLPVVHPWLPAAAHGAHAAARPRPGGQRAGHHSVSSLGSCNTSGGLAGSWRSWHVAIARSCPAPNVLPVDSCLVSFPPAVRLPIQGWPAGERCTPDFVPFANAFLPFITQRTQIHTAPCFSLDTATQDCCMHEMQCQPQRLLALPPRRRQLHSQATPVKPN